VSQPAIDVPGLLKRYGLRPDKRLGQNFLIDDKALSRVLAAGEPGSDDLVLEIGPGVGSLTRLLAQHAGRVVAVELDPDLLPPLQEVIAGFPNITVIQGDILQLNLAEILSPTGLPAAARLLPESNYLTIANIPYYISSALIRYLLENDLPPKRMVFTIQREVAERICAQPGKLSLLALSVQVYGRPEIKAHIPAGAFYPPPQVDSAVLRVDRYTEPLVPTHLLPVFFRLAKAGFSQKRKNLRNALAAGMHWSTEQSKHVLETVEIDPRRRAETLRLEEWSSLAKSVHESQATESNSGI
jgi:16S rRNA (adenine1518-N6/adenine1519-N6)-dimethyltransferase